MRALLLCLILAACGGGGGGPSASGTITPAPAVLRTDLLFGYFAQDAATVNENAAHANLAWSTGDLAGLDQMAMLTQVKAAGRRAVLQLPFCQVPVEQGEAQARFWFQRLHDAGLLEPVAAVAWCDEPSSVGWDETSTTKMSAAVRAAMGAFPELRAALAVIYNCKAGFPGIASFDWIGCDDYDSGCAALTRYYPNLNVNAGQRLLVVPGGADPWRQDPACFLSFAERDPRVVAIVAFSWQTTDGHPGVRDNGLRGLYCEAGRTVVDPAGSHVC